MYWKTPQQGIVAHATKAESDGVRTYMRHTTNIVLSKERNIYLSAKALKHTFYYHLLGNNELMFFDYLPCLQDSHFITPTCYQFLSSLSSISIK